MGYQKDIVNTLRFDYDFDIDGGAVSAIPFRQEHGRTLLDGMKIVGMKIVWSTLATGSATPTIVIGNTADADGYFKDIFALVTTAAKGVVNAGEVAGDLIWDDTNDHFIIYKVGAANTLDLNMTIGTEALTAGKCSLYIDFII